MIQQSEKAVRHLFFSFFGFFPCPIAGATFRFCLRCSCHFWLFFFYLLILLRGSFVLVTFSRCTSCMYLVYISCGIFFVHIFFDCYQVADDSDSDDEVVEEGAAAAAAASTTSAHRRLAGSSEVKRSKFLQYLEAPFFFLHRSNG